MYKIANKNNYGAIKEVEKLQNREYEIIGDIHYILQVQKRCPDLINYNNKTNIATTEKAEELQKFINNAYSNMKQYQFIFI